MNCHFCPKYMGELKNHDLLLSCTDCNVRYSYTSDHSLYGYAFDLIIKNILYSALFYVQINKFEIKYTNVSVPEWNPAILKLNFHPDITPSNFASKLKTLLIFS